MLELPEATVHRLIDVSVESTLARPQARKYIQQSLVKYAERCLFRQQQAFPVVAFVGWGRSGKDTAAEIWCRHHGVAFNGGCSYAALPLLSLALDVVPAKAWSERHLQRGFWFHWLNRFRDGDNASLLVRMALGEADCSAGIRSRAELEACVEQGVIQRVVWIERPGTPVDPTVEYTREDVLALDGIVLENDGTVEQLEAKIVAPSFTKMICGDLF